MKSPLPSSSNHWILLSLILCVFLTGALLPVIGVGFLVGLPMVLFVLCLRYDLRQAGLAFILALGVIGILLVMTGLIPLLPVLAVMGASGILAARQARDGYAIEYIIAIPSGLILGAILIYYVYGGTQLSMTPWQLVEKHVTDAIDLNISLYSRFGASPDDQNAMAGLKDTMTSLFVRIFPAICIISVSFIIWISVLWGGRLLSKRGVHVEPISGLANWKSPAWLAWLFLGGALGSFIPMEPLRSVSLNVWLISGFLYLLQGLAIVSFYFQARRIPVFLRWLFYFFIAVQQILMIAIAALGFIDIWVDFRKYFRENRTKIDKTS